MNNRLRCFHLLLMALSVDLAVADGVLEINQACALNGGCFAGDSAGFPVTIDGSAGVSYRLTSSLNLSSIPATSAIDIDASHITLDLNGFEIAGAITCTGTGQSLDCGTPGSAAGIRLANGSDGVLIRNGTIRNMDSSGISSSAGRLTLMQLRTVNNARNGIRSLSGTIVVDSTAIANGENGFDLGVASLVERSISQSNGNHGFEIEFQKGVVTRSSARFNGGRGFSLGHSAKFRDNTSDLNAEPDRCGGGICTDGRRYYLTIDNTFDGAEVLGACATGFHLASIYEIAEPANLVYDTVLGLTRDQSRSGPPRVIFGWVADGGDDFFSGNCEGWSSNDPGDNGAQARTAILDSTTPNIVVGIWDTARTTCGFDSAVWCIED